MTAFWPTLNTPTTTYTVQDGCGFLDPAYYAARKAVHNAIDLNAVTGKDTDLGDPVYAADGGTVIATAWDKEYIGGGVEILHADGSISGYWHLRDIHVVKGQYVNGGDMIGQMGKGATFKMLAHVHFYVKKAGTNLRIFYWPSTYFKDRAKCEAFIREHYHDPLEWLRARGAKRTLADLQAQRGERTRVLIVRGDELEDVTGKLVAMPSNAATLDAREPSDVRLYVNDPSPASIPALPLKP